MKVEVGKYYSSTKNRTHRDIIKITSLHSVYRDRFYFKWIIKNGSDYSGEYRASIEELIDCGFSIYELTDLDKLRIIK
jgi:hypothetical protein